MTLYDQIGGKPAISAAVERFYVRVLADPMLAPFFEKVDIPRLKAHQLAFLSQTLGGPQQYSGAAMARAHARLSIEQRHFDAVATPLVETLRELGVNEEIVAGVVTAIAPLAQQIVNTVGAASA
jgi:hemoglobin